MELDDIKVQDDIDTETSAHNCLVCKTSVAIDSCLDEILEHCNRLGIHTSGIEACMGALAVVIQDEMDMIPDNDYLRSPESLENEEFGTITADQILSEIVDHSED